MQIITLRAMKTRNISQVLLSFCIPGAVTALWTKWGGNILNNRWASDTAVCGKTVESIRQHCHLGGFAQGGFAQGVSAPPAIHEDVAYFPSWDGLVTAYEYRTCAIRWQTNITAFLQQYAAPDPDQVLFSPPVSRTTPQIDGDVMYIGTQRYALLLALDLETGVVVAHVQINPHPLAIVTMSPTFHNGKIFIGTASAEESAAADPVCEHDAVHVS